MNFYIIESDIKNQQLFTNLVEDDFENSILGITADFTQAYDQLLQFRVDVLILPFAAENSGGGTGVDLITRLRQVNVRPKIIITGPNDHQIKSQAYQAGALVYLQTPINVDEAAQLLKLISTQVTLTTKLRTISQLSSITQLQLHQQVSRDQIEHVSDILRFLGIAAEPGSHDILKIIRLMVYQKLNFNDIDFERDLKFDDREKKNSLQRIRRTLKVGITNLAAMCIDYPENELLLEYANNLFEYKNIHVEIQRLNQEQPDNSQLSLPHFFLMDYYKKH